MAKLLLVSSSARIISEPVEPIAAINRFDGVTIRTIRKYVDRLKGTEILLLSPKYGLISSKKKIPYHDLIGTNWRDNSFDKDSIEPIKKANIALLKRLMLKNTYDEIYVNVGKSMLPFIEDFEDIVPKTTKITCSEGRGIGPKTAHMKEWIMQQH